ncbi:MAG TPA: Fe-S oxidoreductase [Lachnospiraceae bacterium]|jgi:radical SAM-linked protein|nr:Fe-S oxidoreductase [Lachnospiraceae bacterium]
MKVRIKFQKYGAMKFIGHLDVVRYFQKAFRRAGFDSVYTNGFSPRPVMSFAAPLGLGLTSDGEYLDAELVSSEEPKVMIDKLNAVLTEGFHVTGFHILKDREEHQKAVTAMALVSSADYRVSLKDGYDHVEILKSKEAFQKAFADFISKEKIVIDKKTKTSEKAVDIKPMITLTAFDEKEYRDKLSAKIQDNSQQAFDLPESTAEVYQNGIMVYLQLDTGSTVNLKPELVMEAFYQFQNLPYNKFSWQVHRLEIYTRDSDTGKLISLDHLER